MKKTFSSLVASSILALVVFSTNITCMFIFHQDKIPSDAKKLRRF